MQPYITIGIGAVILNDKNEVLLALRGKAPEQNKWSIPGGKVELFESLADATIREIKEEVNLDIEIDKLLCTAETIDKSTNEHYVSIVYSTKNVQGTLKNMEPDKLQDVRWFNLSNLPEELACFSIEAIEITKKHFSLAR